MVGAVESEDWLSVAKQAIQERMTDAHIKFNLMAVTADPRVALRSKLETADSEGARADVAAALAARDQQREQWKLENQRRRHNYLPLCVQLFKELAKTGTLPELVTDAKQRYAAKRAAAKAGKS